MREIVDRILQEEESARSRVDAAQNQAQNIILKAKEEAKILIQDAVNKARDMAENKKEEAEKSFLAQKENILKEASDSMAVARGSREKDIPEIARNIFLKIITIKG